MNRIAIFSDIHGNYSALSKILEDIKNKGINDIICLGDTICNGPNSKECLNLIIDNNVNMVLGNYELYVIKGDSIDDELSELKRQNIRQVKNELTDKQIEFLNNCKLQIKRGNISFQHFLFNSNKEDLYPFEEIDIIGTDKVVLDSDITFIGHEHNPFEITVDGKRLIDVGSSGEDTIYYTVIDIDNNEIEKVQLS